MDQKMSAEDAVGLLTGYDEQAIAKHFGEEIYVLAETKPVTMLRALVFVQLRRDGQKDADAKNAALSLPLRELQTWFPDVEEETFPNEPVTDQGKDDSQHSELRSA